MNVITSVMVENLMLGYTQRKAVELMRLIDADELKKLFPDNGEGSWTYNVAAKGYIDAQPTAYDLDKVVEALEKLKEDAEWDLEVALDDRHREIAENRLDAFNKAIEIVKKGGAE